MKQLLTFGGVSLIGTAAHWALLALWVEGLHWPAWYGSLAGAGLGMVVNFLFHLRLTFPEADGGWRAFGRFCLSASVGFAINALVMAVALSVGLHWLLAQGSATLAAFLSNYLLAKFWVFRSPKDPA